MSGVKEYKLKKDIITPVETISVGTVFDFYNGIGKSVDYECTVVKSEVEDFDEWFEEVGGRWRAEKGGEYYIITTYGEAVSLHERYDDQDDYSWRIGNYFKTEDEADDYRNYLLAKQRLKDSANGFTPRVSDFFYSISKNKGKLCVMYTLYTAGGIFFRSERVAEESLEKHKDDWELVINYETKGL